MQVSDWSRALRNFLGLGFGALLSGLVLNLSEEPHPRITVPPGTICDYGMEKDLLCK